MTRSAPLEPHRYTLYPAERDVLIWLLYQTRYLALEYTAMVEIGAFEGETTEMLAQHRDGRPFIVIDPWDGTQDSAGEAVYQRFCTRMARWLGPPPQYGALITPPIEVRRQRSQDATPPPHLGFVLHDGDHRDLSDLPRWWEALVPRGIVVVHDVADAGWPAVQQAVEQLGRPWHCYRYQPTAADILAYGPGPRGMAWKVKTP